MVQSFLLWQASLSQYSFTQYSIWIWNKATTKVTPKFLLITSPSLVAVLIIDDSWDTGPLYDLREACHFPVADMSQLEVIYIVGKHLENTVMVSNSVVSL